MKTFSTKLQAVSLGEVLKFYVEGFQLNEKKIVRWDAYVDTARDTVIFDLVIEETKRRKS